MRVEKDDNCVLSTAKPLIQLGTNITSLRDAMSLSRDALAEIVGSSASHIAKLERGKTDCPGYFVIENLARFFGVTTTQLVNDDLSLLCSREQAVKRVVENFSDDEWRVLTIMVDGLTRDQAAAGHFRK